MLPKASNGSWPHTTWWWLLSLVLLASCQSSPPSGAELVQRSKPLLGTFVTITVSAPERDTALEAITAAFQEFERIDKLMSVHRTDSEISRLNSRGVNEPIPVSPELYQVTAQALRIARETQGAFDPTIRPIAELWGFIWKEYRLPNPEELETVLPRVNYRAVKLGDENRTIHFSRPAVSLDLNGIAKGYAVDCALEKLLSLGFTNAMVKAGGDIRVAGHPSGEKFWTIQLEDPKKRGQRIAIPLRDAALSTSGNYENFFTMNGKSYSHILNPRTGMPVENIAACTVIAPTCMESDALATAFMVYGVEESVAKFGDRYGIHFTVMPEAPGGELKVLQNRLFPGAQNAY